VGIPEQSILIAHDHQLGSLTERAEMMVKLYDYATHVRGVNLILGNGDLNQGRNYRRFVIENAVLGAMGAGQQSRNSTRILRPFLTHECVQGVIMLDGNHEQRSDRDEHGFLFHLGIEATIEEHNRARRKEGKRPIDFRYIQFAVLPNGDMVDAELAGIPLGPYLLGALHTWSEKGAGKGHGGFPVSHPASWDYNMGKLSPFDVFSQAHFHQTNVLVQNDKLFLLLGCTAGTSGFETKRQYQILQPASGILHVHSDGRIGVEVVSEKFLDQYTPQHPDLKQGVSSFITEAFRFPVHHIDPRNPEPQKLYHREPSFIPLKSTPGKPPQNLVRVPEGSRS
jgi:hypothetical protein